jgi:filamentous hemagglutinin family protein
VNTNYSRASVPANSRRIERRRNRARIIVACAVGPIVAALSPRASAGVQLSGVAAGSAAVSQQGAVTTIRTGTNNTILYFSKFDIAGGSTVNFLQPSAAGRVLDHVTSATPSLINGTIQSNGSVYLINPAGVIFGAGAVVDVNRFYAAAANFSNQDFLGGIDHFTAVSGMVSNSGQIRANQVSLIGSQVMNQGNIIAPNGYVAMLAGSDVLVSSVGSHITAKVVSPGPVAGATVSASGGAATSFDLRNSAMAAGDVYSLAIRHTGSIQASNVLINGGQGQVQISGSIDASSHAAGGVGGSVAITGGEVNVASANINVSGVAGGGSVEIGGGVHGSGDLAHAQIVSVDSSSTINADATGNGTGGSIALWSDGTTSDAGTLTARGGLLGGNGGFIETSGAVVNVISAPNASAPHGTAGTWLLDPLDVEIVNAPNDGTQLTGTTPASNIGSPVNNGSIETALEGGTNVTISTDQAGADVGTLSQDADAPIAVTLANGGAVLLTLQSNASMTLSGGISTTTGSTVLNVELDQLNGTLSPVGVNAPININGSLTIVGGNVTIAAGADVTASSLSITSGPATGLSGTSFPSTLGLVTIDAPVSITGAGTVSITTATSVTSITAGTITTAGGGVTISSVGPVTLGGAVATGGGVFTTTGTSFEEDGGISDGGTNASNNALTVNTSSGTGSINLNGAIAWSGTGGVKIEGGGTVITQTTGTITGTAGAPVSLFTTGAGASITVDGNVHTTGVFTESGGSFTLGATLGVVASSESINVATAAFDAKTVTPTTVSINGPISATVSAGAILSGGLSFVSTAPGTLTTNDGAVTITTSTGTTIGGAVDTTGGAFTVTGTSFDSEAAISIGTATNSVFSVITSSGTGSLNVNGAISWAGSGGVLLEGAGAVSTTTLGTITSSGATAMPVSIFSTFVPPGGGAAAIVTIAGNIDTNGPFVASGGAFTVNTAGTTVGGTLTAAGVIASSGSINSVVVTPDAKPVAPAATVIDGPMSFTGAFTGGGTTFTSDAAGTITSGGGGVTITTTTGTTLGGIVSTGGGAFTASAGISFENDAAITVGNGTTSNTLFSVSTAGSGNIDINGAITWTGTGGVKISGTSQVSTTSLGTITATGAAAMPVSLFTTAVDSSIGTTGVTIGGTVTTPGPFVASGGNFILSANIALTAGSVSLNMPSAAPLPVTTPNTVTIGGPISATISGAGGFIDIGGAVLVTDNTTGTLTSTGGPIVFSNTGLIAMGNAIVTGGGAFTVSGSDNFTASGAPITTSGGNISITTTTSEGAQISTDSPVNTGGGSFTVRAQTFENDSTITDGGVATATGEVNIDTTGGTGAVTINGTITWVGGASRNVDIEGGGDVNVTSIVSSGAAALPVTVFTTGSGNGVTINGAIITSGTFISSGNSVNIGSAGSVQAQAVSLNIMTTTTNGHPVVPGSVSVAGPITTNDGIFSAGGTSFSSSGAGSITTNGGNVNLLTPGGVSVGGAVSTGGGVFSAVNDNTFISTTGGTITTLGGAVTINSIGTVGNSTGEITIGDEINTGGGAFTSNGSTFTSSGEITDGGINDAQSVSITTTGGDITLNTGGDINWAASLGSITFVVPGGSNLGLGAAITGNPAEPIILTGVTLSLVGQQSTITGGNISVGTIVNPDNTTAPSLAIQSAGTVTIGAVGTPTSPIGSLTVINNGSSAQPVTTLNGDVNSTGTVDFGGSVILAVDVAITTSDLSTNPLDHLIEFDGTIEGAHGLTVTLPLPPNIANGPSVEEIRFNSNIGDQTPLTFLNLNTNGDGIVFFRAGPPISTASSEFGNLPGVNDPQPLTIIDIASGGSFKVNDGPPPSPKQTSIILSSIDSYGPLTVNIGSASTPNAANLFAVGQYEKITSYGDLTINTNGGTAQIGDLSSFGNMTVNAANIEFLLRQPTFENNVALDQGVDLIASGEMTLPANAVYTAVSPFGAGAFGVPGFIAGSFNPNSNISAIASSLKTAISNAPSIPASALFFPEFNLLLDLTPSTLTSKLPTFVPPIPSVFDLPAGGALPRQLLVAGTVTPDFKNAMMASYPGPIVQQDLKDDGIFTRELSIEEIVDATDSIVVYNDTPRKRRPRAEDFHVAVSRLNSSRVQKFLDQYHELFAASSVNSADTTSRRAQIAGDLQEAWDAYVGQNGYKHATGAGFQHYVATTPSASKAADELVQLNSLLQQLNTLGLSHKEAQMAFQHNVLAGLPANGMQDGDLMAAVETTGNNGNGQ